MGGIGSGRSRSARSKGIVDRHRFLDIRRWKRDGLLLAPRDFVWQWSRYDEVVASVHVTVREDRVILSHRRQIGFWDWRTERYPVAIHWSRCYFGNRRPWFSCPAQGCGRRVALLYAYGIFACRHCHRLAYQSQRENKYERAERRAERVRRKLGWSPGILNDDGGKPKGIHWSTFERLKSQHDALVEASLEESLFYNIDLFRDLLSDR